MLIVLIITVLSFSFFLHVYHLSLYVIKREQKNLRGFINTAIANVLIAISLMFLALSKPELITNIDLKQLSWVLSGLVLVVSLFIKGNIFRNVYKRCQLPENFHYNYFGKKVLHPGVIKNYEFLLFFITMPFFLFAGSYFVARLVNLIRFGQL